MKVFVINVDKDNRRMESLHKHLVEHDIEYDRVTAETGPDEDFSSVLRHTCSKGVLGSFTSHRKIWKQIVDEELDMAMILEDDARFTENAPEVLNKVLEQLPPDFDILYLGCGGVCDDSVKSPFDLVHFMMLLTPKASKTVSENLVVPAAPMEIHAYIISRKGAETLLKKKPTMCFGDLDIGITDNLHLYACKPSIAIQDRETFVSHAVSKFPKLINGIIGEQYNLDIIGFRLFDTLSFNWWTVLLGVLIAYFPWAILVLIPDVYDSPNMIVSTLFVTMLIKIVQEI